MQCFFLLLQILLSIYFLFSMVFVLNVRVCVELLWYVRFRGPFLYFFALTNKDFADQILASYDFYSYTMYNLQFTYIYSRKPQEELVQGGSIGREAKRWAEEELIYNLETNKVYCTLWVKWG